MKHLDIIPNTNITILNNEILSIDKIEGFNLLTAEQKLFCIEYANSNLHKTKSALNSGVSIRFINEWFLTDQNFITVTSFIKSYIGDTLFSKHLQDAMDDPKIRTSVLTALGVDGFKKELKTTTNNNLIIQNSGGLKGLIDTFSKD